ncbi:L,D-transpeptidase [Streptomyces sp. RPT161]|uniref:L,D-transpeptidase n=1 Tax=Streptomyces sp. RPT161 TaxID=3015993 RepID=UPI002FD313B1
MKRTVGRSKVGGAKGAAAYRRRAAAAAVGLSALALGVSACSTPAHGQGAGSAAAAVDPAKITVTMDKDSSGDVVPDKPVKIGVQDGKLASVTVADSKGDAIPGTLDAATGTWTPSSPFGVGLNYTLRASATTPGHNGRPATQQVNFTVETPGKALELDSITPAKGAVVGVAMPISIVFSHPVADSAKASVEKQLKVTTSPAVTGSWHWFGDERVDWRPQQFWKSGTHVTVDANLNGVNDGNGRYGTHNYEHSFTIGSDVEAVSDTASHKLNVYQDGKLVRSLAADSGKAGFSTWGGTMAVIDKQPVVEMTSCSVGIQCDKNGPNYYDLKLPWDVHLTDSGTYVHYSTGDTDPGLDNNSHGCIHLSLDDAKWFYNFVKQGDPVTVKGEPKNAAPDNGYADYNLDWSQWVAGSALHS